MGVHQYQIALLPRLIFNSGVPSALSEAEIECGQEATIGWWAKFPPSQNLLNQLRSLLPINKSWGETEEFVSQDEWGSDLRIWKNGEKVWGITFRFSAIEGNRHLLQRFLSIAQNENCLLLESKTGMVFEPDEKNVSARLSLSRAAQFVRDPENTIVQAAKELQNRK